jgi:hypothetical protein
MMSKFVFAAVFLASAVANAADEVSCFSGYISDTFCISNGVFLDKPGIPLLHPEEHTIHCLLDPPMCIASLEVLAPPAEVGGNYTRAAMLDAAGSVLIAEYGKAIGAGCNGCVGDQEAGLNATIFGTFHNETTDPPMLNVSYVLPVDVGCGYADIEADFCYEGYISDTYCISNGVFLDMPGDPLLNPEEHTVLCLVDPPVCRASYEILGEPTELGGNYSRVARLDSVGTALIVHYARQIGAGCSGCIGTQEKGLRATVMGKKAVNVATADDGTPPLVLVTKVLGSEVGCSASTTMAPAAAPVSAPSSPTAPQPVPAAAPVSVPSSPTAPQPVLATGGTSAATYRSISIGVVVSTVLLLTTIQ